MLVLLLSIGRVVILIAGYPTFTEKLLGDECIAQKGDTGILLGNCTNLL